MIPYIEEKIWCRWDLKNFCLFLNKDMGRIGENRENRKKFGNSNIFERYKKYILCTCIFPGVD